MNILYLANHLNTGGITSYLFALATGAKQRGHKVYLASSPGGLAPKFVEAGMEFIPIPIMTKSELSPKIWISLFKLLPLVKEKDIQIIHANTRVTQVLAYLLARLSGRPFISTCHGFFKPRLARRIFGCWGDKVIAISEQVKEHLTDDFRVPESDIRVINNGIDIMRFSSAGPATKQERTALGLKDGPVIGIIARLSDVKGHIYLIQAMALVLRDIPSAQLLIIGEGKMKEELVNSVRDLKIEKSVIFIPTLSDTPRALAAMDIFVMPSLAEGFGLGAAEAMAAGVCVVASDIGGLRSLITDNLNGVLVESKNSVALAKAIVNLLSDENKRKALALAGRNFVKENFSSEKCAYLTCEVYSECLKEKP